MAATKSETTKARAKRAVKALIADLSDRRGLRQEWEQIDDDIRKEIRATWEGIFEQAMR